MNVGATRFRRVANPGLAVYEGGMFDTTEPNHSWVETTLSLWGRVASRRGENQRKP